MDLIGIVSLLVILSGQETWAAMERYKKFKDIKVQSFVTTKDVGETSC